MKFEEFDWTRIKIKINTLLWEELPGDRVTLDEADKLAGEMFTLVQNFINRKVNP